jgi:hypothetical protein
MAQCLSLSLLAATKPRSQWQRDTRNITQSICRSEISQTSFDVLMEIQYFPSRSSLSPKVSFSDVFLLLLTSLAASKNQRKTANYQTFCRQMYHACLARVFNPLKDGMTTPEVVRCPDGHFRRAVYGLGPYIADYPEQVWLSGIVQGWCPK